MSRSGPVYETSSAHVPDWRDKAECRNYDPELFFPVGQSGFRVTAQIEEAKAVCADCRVFDKCREVSLERREHGGIWAGLTEEERARELRRLGRIKTAGRSAGAKNGESEAWY